MTVAKRFRQIGDEVRWNDPENAECTGVYWIQDIIDDDVPEEGLGSLLILRDDVGYCTEVYTSELN